MRILHIANHVKNSGNGIVNVLVDLACAQADERNAVGVASAGGEFETLLTSRNVSCFRVDQTRTPLNLCRALYRFHRVIKEFQPEVVHAHMMTGALLASLFRRKSTFRLVTTVHNEFQKSATIMGVGDRVIAVSEAVASSMANRGITPRKIRVVRNGPLGTPRRSSSTASASLEMSHPAIVTVAGLYVRKGIIPLLEAFAQVLKRCPSANLYLVGDGPDRAMFEQKAHQLGIAKVVHFEGFQADPSRYLKSADVFVLASLAEPFSLVLSEARDAGLAIIATDVGGSSEALDGGEAGTLVPPNDVAALSDALSEMLSNEPLRRRMSERAARNLDWLRVKRMNDDTMQVYAELVSARGQTGVE